MSLNNEPVNVLNSATASRSTARQATTSSEPASHLDEPESSVAGQPKEAKRNAAARTADEALPILENHLSKTTARVQKQAVGLIRRPTTQAMVEANRANSLKCTGPVTDVGKVNVRLNALKHGIEAFLGGMARPELGEVPGDVTHIQEELEECFRPEDRFEFLLVDQMTENRWRRRRVLRAESSILAAQAVQFELDYGQKLAGEGRSPGSTGEARLAAASGLVALPDSPAKFNLIVQLLTAAQVSVRQEGFGDEGLRLLETVYGPDPGLAGAILLSSYRQGLERAADAPEEAGPDTSSRQAFLEVLAAEIACFEKLLELHESAAASLAKARAIAQHALSESDTQRFTRYEAFLDRQFERLVKLFNERRQSRVEHERPRKLYGK